MANRKSAMSDVAGGETAPEPKKRTPQSPKFSAIRRVLRALQILPTKESMLAVLDFCRAEVEEQAAARGNGQV